MMFSLDYGGTTPKVLQLSSWMVSILSHFANQAVKDRGPETLKSAVQAIYGKFIKFAHYNDVLASSSSKLPTTTKGEIADTAISGQVVGRKSPNCKLTAHQYAKDCPILCSLCPDLLPHKYLATDICIKYISWKASLVKKGTWRDSKQAPTTPMKKITLIFPLPLQHHFLRQLMQI